MRRKVSLLDICHDFTSNCIRYLSASSGPVGKMAAATMSHFKRVVSPRERGILSQETDHGVVDILNLFSAVLYICLIRIDKPRSVPVVYFMQGSFDVVQCPNQQPVQMLGKVRTRGGFVLLQ